MTTPSSTPALRFRRKAALALFGGALLGAAVLGTTATPRAAHAAVSHEMTVQRAMTTWYVPPKTNGDADFFGHGPDVRLEVTLMVRNTSELWAQVKMSAKETTGDVSTASGVHEMRVFSLPAGYRIDAILSPTKTILGYVDRDHEEDYLVPGEGEVRPDRWRIPGGIDGLVRMARVIGDTNGGEAGTKTGVQFFFNHIKLRVSGATAVPSAAKKLAVSDAEREAFPNGCASSAGWRVLEFYGKDISHEAFYKRVTSSGNLVSDNNWGVPPGTLRDRLRDVGVNVQEYRVASKTAAIDTVIKQIDAGRPLIALTGWGGKAARDLYAPAGDTVSWDAGASTLHYVVVHGYDKRQKLVYVLDNGLPKAWSYEYFGSVLFWTGEQPHAVALFDTINVRNATLIY